MGCCKSRKRQDDSETEDLAYPWASERFGEDLAPGPPVPCAPVYGDEGYCLTPEMRNRLPITRHSYGFYEFTPRDM